MNFGLKKINIRNNVGRLTNVLFFGLIAISSLISYSQTPFLDSLQIELKKAQRDTTKCKILNLLIEGENDLSVWARYNDELYDLSIKNLKGIQGTTSEKQTYMDYLSDALNNKGVILEIEDRNDEALKKYKLSLKIIEISRGSKYKIAKAVCLNNIGYIYNKQGDLDTALSFYNESLKLRTEANHQLGIAESYDNIGGIYRAKGDLVKAIYYNNKSLLIREKIGDPYSLAISYQNLSFLYDSQGDIHKSKEFLDKSIKLRESINDIEGLSYCYNNLAFYYKVKSKFDSSLFFLGKSLKLRRQLNEISGEIECLNNIGTVYLDIDDFEQAEIFLLNALALLDQVENPDQESSTYVNLGHLYLEKKQFVKALDYTKKADIIARRIGYSDILKDASEQLSHIYMAMGNYKMAFEKYHVFIEMRDSLNNLETQKSIIKQQTNYEYEKKKAIDDRLHDLEIRQSKEKASAQKTKQNIIIASVSVVLILVAVFSVFLYNRFKVTQRQKEVIELKEKETHAQKEIIEEKHKEITDSINYAERIQRSFLASNELLDENLQPANYFVFFKPKDVVSGDFYWASKLKNGNFALVTADSTGHGVPGAIMSLLNITSLEKAIESTSNPSEILELTRRTIIERLKKDGSIEGGKDGMDCSLISFNRAESQLEIAAAHNPVWVIRNHELIEVKPDKMPVGKHDRDQDSFTLHTLDLLEGDIIYAITDGYPDQFGGEKGKKFMSKNLKELLKSNAHLPMTDQKVVLEKTFSDWVGDLEQVDDVTIVGIRI
jgi:serine phosphatase RsbU (regulator of sigma subunit)/Flp pilus assembly protein TadD